MICFSGDYMEERESFTAIFIGGPMDGRVLQMERYTPQIFIPVLKSPSCLLDLPHGLGPSCDDCCFDRFVYESQGWKCGGKPFILYVPTGTSPEETMRRLLESYTSKATEREEARK